MVREVLTVNVGQCGIQLGHEIWNEYCWEHHIDAHGNRTRKTQNDVPLCFFEESDSGKYVPRTLMVDLEPNVIDDIRGPLYNPEFLISGSEDAANCFARGHYTVGKEVIDKVNDRIRKLVDNCDNLQGFMMNHSVGGGTGSGLGALILERLAVDYRKKAKFGCEVYPSPTISTAVVEPYNALLATHWLLDHTEVSLVFDNEAMYEIGQFALGIKHPSYRDVNQTLATLVSSVTESLRFENELNVDLNEFQTNLVPFPRLHFLISSMSPILTAPQRRALPKNTRQCVMIGNNTAMSRFFSERISKRFDLMYSQRAFVHWYVGEGMEEGEFAEAREDLGFLEKDYLDVLSEQATDEDDEDEEESTGSHHSRPQVKKKQTPPASQSRQLPQPITYGPQRGLPFSPTTKMDVQSLSSAAMAGQNFFVKVGDFDAEEDKYMAISVNYRGNVRAKEANAAVQWLKTNKKCTFVEWCPTGFKVGVAGDDDDDMIGFAVGGARDVNTFRELVASNRVPSKSAVTYNGLLYEYYFDTKTRAHEQEQELEPPKAAPEEEKTEEGATDDGSQLFYPSYCFAKTTKMDFVAAADGDDDEKERGSGFEYYMTVGLNSNMKQSEFKRKNLNLVIVLDISGSMGWGFRRGDVQTKMQVANQAVVTLLGHLRPEDRFGLVLFDTNSKVMQPLQFVDSLDMDALKAQVLRIQQQGGTDFEVGYSAAIRLYDDLQAQWQAQDMGEISEMNRMYDNRIIFLTDAQPNGYTHDYSLFGMTRRHAENEARRIYTTFIGVGLDFKTELVETITDCRGCNYYSVMSASDFDKTMKEDFEFMVTPLVFNVVLRINCEGDVCQIEKVYGAPDAKADQIVQSGEITRIDTLFPSVSSKKKGGTKGGIQLIKLKQNPQCADDKMNAEVVVTFEDRYGRKFTNTQMVRFQPPKLQPINDMIGDDDGEDDDDEDNGDTEDLNFYDNLGIRKGILLCKYVELLHSWSDSNHQHPLTKARYKAIFERFLQHFRKEMKRCKDMQLQKEVEIVQKLINGNLS